MKKKSVFFQLVLLIIIIVCGILLTVTATLFAGSDSRMLFDFKDFNIANAIPVLILGIFITCVVAGIVVLFISRAAFYKVKEYLKETNKNGGNEK